ncbi:hypothetical protein [Motilimonas pumila]|uniref:hypothetical protein n=1 Tax=Motilimonas pumila TaxID=2303987 RepID=UPI001314F28F|nr:hypothetical protein [Motilimonas pumila]
MAFDMYADQLQEKIAHNEEFLFTYVNENEDFPLLNLVWEAFYDGPEIYPEQSNSLVHELISLKALHPSDKYLANTIDRLLVFFSLCYQNDSTIKCVSD